MKSLKKMILVLAIFIGLNFFLMGINIIQKGGKYRSDPGFILFDIKIGRWWLQEEDVKKIANELEIDMVPLIGCTTLLDAVKYAKCGFKSTFGDFIAEGMVLHPEIQLFARNGERVITKIKYKDFNKEVK